MKTDVLNDISSAVKKVAKQFMDLIPKPDNSIA